MSKKISLVGRVFGSLKHGHARLNSHTKTYEAWCGMKRRCANLYDIDYGGRGILVCERWEQFENFLADMGECPPKLTIERIDHNGNYEPANCKWDTQKNQQRNKRSNRIFTILGITGCVTKLAEHFGVVNHHTVSMRINRYGWEPERAFLEPVHKNGGWHQS